MSVAILFDKYYEQSSFSCGDIISHDDHNDHTDGHTDGHTDNDDRDDHFDNHTDHNR